MNPHDKEIIEQFLNQANHKVAKSNQKFLAQEKDESSLHDIVLGIPLSTIKEYVKSMPPLELNTLKEIVQCEYNEARVLGWALLARDFPQTNIIKYFVSHFSHFCGNWNVVDFAAPLSSKIMLKNDGPQVVQSLGYELLYQDDNVWSHRFALGMSLPLVKNGTLNFAIDVTERFLDSKDDLICKPCGLILKEIGNQNKNILRIFIQDHKHRMAEVTKMYALEAFTSEEQKQFN